MRIKNINEAMTYVDHRGFRVFTLLFAVLRFSTRAKFKKAGFN